MSESDTVTLTRGEFDTAVHFGAAGTANALGEATIERWRSEQPQWKGKHWGYTDASEHPHGARFLRPINVAPRKS